MKVLITDGENRSALAVTRSLGKKGCTVFISGSQPGNISASSKYCSKAYTTPDPLNDAEGYKLAVEEIVQQEHIGAIFPMTEQSICCLNRARKHLGELVILACAPPEKMAAVSNKFSLFRQAEILGVAIPETMYVASSDESKEILTSITSFPVVVKPSFSKIEEGGRIISTRVMYASNPNELRELYATKTVLRYPSLIQEKVEGPGTGLFTLFDKDRHLALFSHRRLREKPPSGGVSVVSESVPLDEEMVEAARRLLSAVEWNGVAMVEFKRDQRDGKAKLMEINGRFWGSLQLAIACGVDFPALLLDHLQGKNPSVQIKKYQLRHRLKWFFGTLDHMVIRLKNRSEDLNLPLGAPSRLKSVTDFLRVVEKDTSFDVFDPNDIGPFWREACSYFKQITGIKS